MNLQKSAVYASEGEPGEDLDRDPLETWDGFPRARTLAKLDRGIRRSLWLSALGIAVALPLPWLVGLANPSYFAVTAGFVLLALLFARAEPRSARPVFLGLFGIALLIQQLAHLGLFWLGSRAGGPFLGPDAQAYFALGQKIAELDFPPGLRMVSELGTYDLAHLYLFGAAIEALNADLFCLQVMNGGFMALVGALTYSWTRIALPRQAIVIGTLVALFPSSMILSSLDLLKDPSVTFCFVLGVWALFKLSRASSVVETSLYVLAGALGLAYVHMARFYLLTHLEIAAAGAFFFALIHRRQVDAHGAGERRPQGATSVGWLIAVVLIFSLAEIGPRLVGWPWSPVFYIGTVERVQETPAIRDYDPGLASKLVTPETTSAESPAVPTPPSPPATSAKAPVAPSPTPPEAHGGLPPAKPPSPPTAAPAPEPSARPQPAPPYTTREDIPRGSPPVPSVKHPPAPEPVEPNKPSPATKPSLEPPPIHAEGLTVSGVTAATNFVRRFYGPFVWIMPVEWSAESILRRDYLYYPGMLVLYSLWPLIAVGLLSLVAKSARGTVLSFGLTMITLYCLISLAQYTMLNLSYRQRDTLFPLLALFAVVGFHVIRKHRSLRFAYGLYWLLLVGLAAFHLLLRSQLLG